MCQSTVSNHQKLWKIHPFLMGKSTISMVIFNSKLLVYQRVYKLGILLSMAFQMTPKLIIMEIPINRSAKCHNHSQLSKQFLVLELGMIPNYLLPFQIINYHHTTYDHSFVYYHIWCIYTYIYICVCVSIMYIHVHSCTYIYIYPYVTIIHSPFFVHLLPWHPVRFHRFAFRNTVTHRTLW